MIENLQAAETLFDRRPDLALIYGAGYSGPSTLRLIAALATDAPRVLLIPDADADGVAIAARWLQAAPAAEIVDIGTVDHEPTEPLPKWALRKLEEQEQDHAAVAAFARTVRERGYALEEEMLVVRALEKALRTAQRSAEDTIRREIA